MDSTAEGKGQRKGSVNRNIDAQTWPNLNSGEKTDRKKNAGALGTMELKQRANLWAGRVPEGGEEGGEPGNVLREIMTESFPNLGRQMPNV